MLETGQTQNINVRIANYKDAVAALDTQIKALELKDAIKYKVAKYAFVFGLLLLMSSRAAAGVAGLFGYALL